MRDIYFLKNSEIDRQKWKATLAASPNRLLFAEDWYLDIVSPNWGALIRGNYEELFPLPIKKKWGIKYLVQPEFTAQLGLFSQKPVPQNCDDFLTEVRRKFRRFHFNLNAENRLEKYEGLPMVNCELPLNQPYPTLYSGYSKSTKRNVKKAVKAGMEIKKMPFEEYFIFKMKSMENAPYPADYEKLKAINLAFSQNQIPVNIVSFVHENETVAAGMFVNYFGRIYYFNGASSPKGKQFSVMYALIDYIIKTEAGDEKILDFKGGQMKGTGDFFRRFGATGNPYLRVLRKF